MRQKNETATSFNQFKEITQAIQAQKRSAQTSAQKPKFSVQAKKDALKPTKKAFSERQKTTIRDNSQASAKKSQETKQGDKQGDNANAFKIDEANTRGQE